MKSPNFENCQIELNEDGTIGKISEAFVSWVGQSREELRDEFPSFLFVFEKKLGTPHSSDFHHADFECFHLSRRIPGNPLSVSFSTS